MSLKSSYLTWSFIHRLDRVWKVPTLFPIKQKKGKVTSSECKPTLWFRRPSVYPGPYIPTDWRFRRITPSLTVTRCKIHGTLSRDRVTSCRPPGRSLRTTRTTYNHRYLSDLRSSGRFHIMYEIVVCESFSSPWVTMIFYNYVVNQRETRRDVENLNTE